MKIGIFSDIHGNLEALVTALAFFKAEGVIECLCLGDIVGYGPNPEECVQLIRELPGVVVAGNHDYGAVGKAPIESFSETARQALLWTADRLSTDSRHYVESLPLVEVRHGFRLVHSAPSAPDDWEYITSLTDIMYEMEAFPEPVCIVGHSHIPFAARKHDSKRAPQPIRESQFALTNSAGKFLVNDGSVGQPRDGDPRLSLVVYDSTRRVMSFHRLDYDLEVTQRKILDAGLPEVLAHRLSLGR